MGCLGRLTIRRGALDNSQCVDELECNGFGFALFVLWSKGQNANPKSQSRKKDKLGVPLNCRITRPPP